jgi:hypothetical protein
MVAVGLTAAEVVEILVEDAMVEDGTLEVIADEEILDDETLVEEAMLEDGMLEVIADEEILDDETLVEEAADEVALVEEGLTVDEMTEELEVAQAEGLNLLWKVFSRIVFIQ